MNLADVTSNVGDVAAVAWAWAVEFLPRISGALLIFVIGAVLAGWAARGLDRVTTRSGRVDPTLRPVVIAIVRYTIFIVAFIAVLSQLGVQTTSVLAVLGAAGLAIGLALQGTLANIAAGLMLLWLRPFRAGEQIETTGVSGRVTEVGLFATRLDTHDGIYRFVPNAELWPKSISNYTRNPRRMMTINFQVAHGNDLSVLRRTVLELAAVDERIHKAPPPEIFVDSLVEKGTVLAFRAWVDTVAFWPTQRRMIEAIKSGSEAAGVKFPG